MLPQRFIVWMTYSVGLIVLGVSAVLGQNYPNKPYVWLPDLF